MKNLYSRNLFLGVNNRWTLSILNMYSNPVSNPVLFFLAPDFLMLRFDDLLLVPHALQLKLGVLALVVPLVALVVLLPQAQLQGLLGHPLPPLLRVPRVVHLAALGVADVAQQVPLLVGEPG